MLVLARRTPGYGLGAGFRWGPSPCKALAAAAAAKCGMSGRDLSKPCGRAMWRMVSSVLAGAKLSSELRGLMVEQLCLLVLVYRINRS